MGSAWLRRVALTALVAGLGIGPSGCAEERDEINTVQPLAIKKSDLVGDITKPTDAPEFYMRSIILEVARTNPWVSDGLQDLTRRVRFEVTENFLIARNAYEYIANSDGKGGAKGKINNGPVVGKWAITRHFDIRKGYNAQTGELSNVIEENVSDRPWYEREFIRVDWSRNLADDPNQIFWWETFSGGLKWSNLQYAESDKAREEIRSDFKDIHKGYFETTSRWMAQPETLDYYGYALPACFLRQYNLYQGAYNADPSIDCNEQEMTMRTGFWKVPTGEASTDYETAEIRTRWQGNIVGNLTLDRSGYDRQYGIVDDTWHTYIMRYNLWKKSHTATDCGNEEARTFEESDFTCANAEINSTCDRRIGKCTIPYEKRTIKPLAFFVDPALPKSLIPNTQNSIDDWNRALGEAVSYAREMECRKAAEFSLERDDAGKPLPKYKKINDEETRISCHKKYFKGDLNDAGTEIDIRKEAIPVEPNTDKELTVTVLCHNPVIKGDNEVCGPEGRTVRKGDIREHMIAWWQNPSFSRPLGVIVWSGDPISGENIGSTVNIFGASVETYSARARDQVMLVNGDLTPSEYVAGLTQKWYSDTTPSLEGDTPRQPELDAMAAKFKNGGGTSLTPQEAQQRIAAVHPQLREMASKMGFNAGLASAKNPAERLVAYNNFVAKRANDGSQYFRTRAEYDAKLSKQMEKARASGMEPTLMNDLWLSSTGIDPKFANEAPVKQIMSPLQGMSSSVLARMEQTEMERRRLMHTCMLEAPEFLTFNWTAGFSAKMKAKYPDGSVASGPLAEAAGVAGQTIDRVVRGRLIYQELIGKMYEDTLLHEMGHLMSMEHAFTGTWDSPNYHPEYWTLRANGKKSNMTTCPAGGRAPGSPDTCVGPRWLDPQTDDEKGIAKGREHDSADSYAVSSVMDYKFDALHGPRLGQFDHMAAKYIYTGLVEMVDDEKYSLIEPTVARRLLPANTLMNAADWFVQPGTPPDSEFIKHYTSLGIMMNIFDERRCRPQTEEEKARDRGQLGVTCMPVHRDHAFVYDTQAVLPSGGFPEDFRVRFGMRPGPEGTNSGAKYRWPYKVSNGQTAYYHSHVYDNGGDIYEIVVDLLDRYEMMYLDYFYRMNKRERNVNGAGRSMFGRFFERVQELQWNTLSDVVRAGGLSTGGSLSFGDQANELALTMLFDAMAKALLRPQPGDYVLNKQPGAMFDLYSNPEGEVTGAPAFSLGAGDSRYVDHQFDLTKQFDYRAYAFRAGSFLEKPFASIALTDARPQLSTVARETYLDGRNVMFSFRSAIPEAFDRLVAGIMADDFDTVAPYIDTADPVDALGMRPLKVMKLWDRNAAALTRPATARLVDPMLGFRVKVPTMILMLLYQPIDTNMELVQRSRIWVTGGQEQVKVNESERVAFFDPVDGMEWNSRTYGTETIAGKIVDRGIGARMIQHANELLAAAYNVDTEAVPGSTLGQVRPRYVGGRPVRGGNPITAADVKDANAAAKLKTYVAFLNQVRSALYYLGFGPVAYSD